VIVLALSLSADDFADVDSADAGFVAGLSPVELDVAVGAAAG
jgi:hypothetical protein